MFDKINFTTYPNLTYLDLHIQQSGENTLIGFPYQALFKFSIHPSLDQSLIKNIFRFTPSTINPHSWVVQTYLLIIPINDTNINNFDPNQTQIDLSHYNISYQVLQIQLQENNTHIQFNYVEHAQIIINNTQSNTLNETTFIFAPPPTWADRFIDLQKAILLPIGAIIGVATLISSYAKRGLLKNILHASDCWTGDPYIKEEAWTPDNKKEMRELRDRHDTPIAMRNIGGLHLFTVSDKDAASSCLTPNYYAYRAQAELLDQELVTTHSISGKAWIKLNPSPLDEMELETFFIQVLAKDGEILGEFPCNLEHLHEHHQGFDLDITGSHTALDSQDKSVELDTMSEPSQTAYSYHARIEWSNPVLQDPQRLQIAYQSAGMQGIDRLIEIGTDSNRYMQFEHLEQMTGTEEAIKSMLWLEEKPVSTSGSQSPNPVHPSNLFWIGMIAYRLPATYDQVHYLLKAAGLDLQEFYEDQGVDEWVNNIGQVLRPSLLLGGATITYCTSSDPLVLLVAANQPGFSAGSDPLSDGIYYLTAILSFARAYASPSAYTLPLVALQGTNLVSHLLVDTGLVAEDHYLMQWMQSATGLVTETLGLFLYPDSPLKALQGISLLAQGLHCAELAWEHLVPYLEYPTHAKVEDTPESQEVDFVQNLTVFS